MKRLAVHLAQLFAVAISACLPHIAWSDSPVAAESAWARTTPRADMALTDPVIRRGKAVFDGHCRACHGPAPSPAARGFYPGTYALEMRYKGKLPEALEDRTDLSAARIAAVVRQGGGGFMPPLRPTELNDAEVKAVAAYLSRRTATP